MSFGPFKKCRCRKCGYEFMTRKKAGSSMVVCPKPECRSGDIEWLEYDYKRDFELMEV